MINHCIASKTIKYILCPICIEGIIRIIFTDVNVKRGFKMGLEQYQCSNHAIAYIDLLGIKEEIKDNQDECLKNMAKALFFVDEVRKKGTSFNFFEKMKTKAFSDNIVFAIEITDEINTETALTGVILASYFFQRMLIQECRYLSRGAITVGDLYIDENIVWGKGLVRAYQLENDIAIFPRVIIDSEVLPALDLSSLSEQNKTLLLCKIKLDFDKNFYIDYSDMSDEESREFIVYLTETCLLRYKINDKVIQKIAWLERMTEKLQQKLSNSCNDTE